jgi:hypothetical protein
MLYMLWEAGYETGIAADPSDVGALRELKRMGYAEKDPCSGGAGHWRVTQDGIDRLIAPMRLTRARLPSTLKRVK